MNSAPKLHIRTAIIQSTDIRSGRTRCDHGRTSFDEFTVLLPLFSYFEILHSQFCRRQLSDMEQYSPMTLLIQLQSDTP